MCYRISNHCNSIKPSDICGWGKGECKDNNHNNNNNNALFAIPLLERRLKLQLPHREQQRHLELDQRQFLSNAPHRPVLKRPEGVLGGRIQRIALADEPSLGDELGRLGPDAGVEMEAGRAADDDESVGGICLACLGVDELKFGATVAAVLQSVYIYLHKGSSSSHDDIDRGRKRLTRQQPLLRTGKNKEDKSQSFLSSRFAATKKNKEENKTYPEPVATSP